MTVFFGLMIPFLGTTLGAACVFFLKSALGTNVQKALLGFASGVMVAASVWSLLIPSMDMSSSMGRLAFVPACGGLLAGMAFLLLMDRVIPHLHMGAEKAEGPSCSLKKSTMLVLAVTLHNIPEGMAVGVVFCRYAGRKCAYHHGSGFCPLYWYCHSELPGRSHYFPSAESGE